MLVSSMSFSVLASSCSLAAAAFHFSSTHSRASRPHKFNLSPSPTASRGIRRRSSAGGHIATCSLLFVDFDHGQDLLREEPVKNGRAALEDGDDNGDTITLFPRLRRALHDPPASYPPRVVAGVLARVRASGFVDDHDVALFAKDFSRSREEALSQMLIQDFGWPALEAHRARVGMATLARAEFPGNGAGAGGPAAAGAPGSDVGAAPGAEAADPAASPSPRSGSDAGAAEGAEGRNSTKTTIKPAPWKSVVVNDKARRRRGKARVGDGSEGHAVDVARGGYNYGLLPATTDNEDRGTYRTLYVEMDRFLTHMTTPRADGAADRPVRDQTAQVYLRHARLFLGWLVDARGARAGADAAPLEDALRHGAGESGGGGGGRGRDEPPSPVDAQVESPAGQADAVRGRVWAHALERISATVSTSGDEHVPRPLKKEDTKERLSLCDIFPTPHAESATVVLEYILWLRSERGISANYEANILRGMIKLVKFRFAKDMSVSSSGRHSGHENPVVASERSTSLEDLPIVTELRKLHREAGNKGKKAPRSSDEKTKWLEWSEYLVVIQLLKTDLGVKIENYNQKVGNVEKRLGGEAQSGKAEKRKPSRDTTTKALEVQKKDIATTFQQYLILSFFACIPDRQRTLRELELERNFMRVDDEGDGGGAVWVIKHTAEDYKTGATYGDRPPLPLLASLTPDIDDFLARWRPALIRSPSEDPSILFLQPRTGNPLTANSVYQIVSRCCYKYKQKKTNPHLLRDMIVTHVRKNADASEKELEALALFMGHSIQMQRDSYDRRTLAQKISPAVKLMQNISSSGDVP